MVIGPDSSREMLPGEEAEVDALLRAAFGGEDEVALVHALRRDGDMASESVTCWHGRVAGYAALSRMVAPEGWLCLAPVAVWLEFQRGALTPVDGRKKYWQVGRRLVSMIAIAAESPALEQVPAIVVLGNPEFYEKCGFSRARAAKLKTPYPSEYTMLAAPGEDVPEAELIYPPAFLAPQTQI
ncbi:GNAT family N-acetyltransferase [Ruegeria sp. HKCCD8929]|uniref:GNAT family N-acetyltransferase n=1 Tax=Ruegeria sp. HKCCD8929 TaxID=2683006 RepID=UPI0014893BD6|nr:N-acetyltransferase [Ruegeria sp. HKCCD8929]